MHKRFARLLAVSLFFIVAVLAQPVVNVAISSASAHGPGMPGSGIAQGSIFSIFGTGLGPAAGVGAETFPLPTTLGGASGTSVTVTAGSTQVSAIILFAASYQINAILPSNTPTGSGSLTVTYNGQTSAPANLQVVSSTFAVYSFNQQDSGQAIATDVNYGLNTIIHTFHPLDYVILWGTGLGAINASDAELPPVGNLPTLVKVYVGNTAAPVIYQGRSGCCAGLDQIVFQIPAGVTGCYVPVAVETGGTLGNIGNFTTIAVSDSGQTCSDSVMGQDLVDQLAAGKTVDFGYVRLESWIAKYVPGSADNANEDFGFATFSEYTPATAGLAQYGVSNGYCVAVDCSYGCGSVMSYTYNFADSSPAQLDAGPVSVQYAPTISLTQEVAGSGFYDSFLSLYGRYLWSQEIYPVAGTGGAAVGAFSVNDVTSIPSATITGISNSQTVPVAADLALQWTGGNSKLQNGQITIYAQSLNQTANNASQFAFVQCTAPAAAQQFTIPAWVLATLPPSGTGGTTGFTYPEGWIQVGQYNTPTTFSAKGLTSGIITDIFYNGVGVYFQ